MTSTSSELRERCELTDLIRAECGHCRPSSSSSTTEAPGFARSSRSPAGEPRPGSQPSELSGLDFGGPDDAGPVFTAQYYSTCSECGEKVEPGDPARMTDDGAVHEDCA